MFFIILNGHSVYEYGVCRADVKLERKKLILISVKNALELIDIKISSLFLFFNIVVRAKYYPFLHALFNFPQL